MLPYIENNTQFAVFCFIVRGFEALGAGAFSTASFIYVIQMFPDNVSGVLVSKETVFSHSYELEMRYIILSVKFFEMQTVFMDV